MECLLLRFSYQTSVYIFLPSQVRHKHHPSHPRAFDSPDVGQGEQITKFLIIHLPTHRPFAAYFLGPDVNILDTLSSIVPPSV